MDWQHLLASRNGRMKASEIRELLKLLDQPDIISFAGGIPDPALLPKAKIQQAYAAVFGDDPQNAALQYSASEGYAPLRRWIQGQMAHYGVPCDIDNILITSGSQQALDYLGKLLLSPNDTALVNWPTYLGALGAFNAYEPHYDQLSPKGNRSADAYRTQAALNGGAIKFAYASVDFANPNGVSLDRRDRDYILDLADELDIAIIEDAAYQALRYEGTPIPPILALEIERKGSIEQCRTIYAGSFSKTLAPGLRVGWVVAAKPVIAQLVLLKQASDLHSPSINQMVVAHVVENGFEQHIEQLRQIYLGRKNCMLAALERYMPQGVEWIKPEGGMFVWVSLPTHINGADLLAKSIETQRVAFVPGQAFFADGSGANTIRLNFTNADDDKIEKGIAALAKVIESCL